MNKKFLISVFCLVSAWGCTPYVAYQTEAPQQTSEQGPKAVSYQVERSSEQQKEISLTIIDTLNKGKEVCLTENDLHSVPALKGGNSSSGTIQFEKTSHYRVQVVAYSQVDRLKEDKKRIAKQLVVPLSIIYDAPNYRLYAGEFKNRDDADSTLSKVKKLGFRDAKVVSTVAGK